MRRLQNQRVNLLIQKRIDETDVGTISKYERSTL